MTTHLDVSIGPVQGFVVQSRRTRDLWGSSYLLSFLAAHALHGAHQAGATIIRPMVDDDLLFAWVGGRREGPPPAIGSVPNHFTVKLSTDEQIDKVTVAMQTAFRLAWQRVCEAVWERFVKHAEPEGNGTKAIWERQVAYFWEVVWVAIAEESSDELTRRKHWRTQSPPDEPGEKCAVMPDLQELSGYARAKGKQARERQQKFWAAVRRRLGPLDLRDNERLSAIALIKRLYVKVANSALGWSVDASHWRSTVYVAALPWIRTVAQAAPSEAKNYALTVQRLAHGDILAQRESECAAGAAGAFPCLDGNYLHRGFLVDRRLCLLQRDDDDGRGRDRLRNQLERLYDRVQQTPPVFYALLLADGDRLGDLVRLLDGRQVGEALTRFTKRVPTIVNSYDGATIYAGGDDVLAMLPLPKALTCARDLARAYAEAFEAVDEAVVAKATLSVGLVFAHMRLPLRSVLSMARKLLHDEAKDHNGRNSLAVGVLKRGGLHSQWVTTWSRATADGDAVDLVTQLAEFLGDDAEGEPGLSSSLLYRLRDTLGLLCDWPGWRPGSWQPLPGKLTFDDLRDFIYAEVLRSLSAGVDEARETRARDITDRICALLSSAKAGERKGPLTIGVDALTLARFLANGGREEHDS